MKHGKEALIFILLFFVAFSLLFVFGPKSNTKSVKLNGSKYLSPANNNQYHASVWLGEYKGELYFVIPWGKKNDPGEGWLCKFSKGEITKIVQLPQSSTDHVEILGISDKYIYYYSDYFGSDLGADRRAKILCYNIVDSEKTTLYYPEIRGNRNIVYFDDSSVCIPLNSENDRMRYLNVVGSEVLGVSTDSGDAIRFVVGDREYYLQYSNNDVVEHVMVRNAEGGTTEIPLGDASQRSLIMTNSGMLIHNYGRRDLLYYVDEKGKVVKLFSVPCSLSTSAVTVYHDVVYISVMRYEKGATSWIGMVGYENDDVIGTYRINLSDFSTEKISDRVYDGMYIFDDTGIFACDDDNRVYKLDFDGKVMDRLL